MFYSIYRYNLRVHLKPQIGFNDIFKEAQQLTSENLDKETVQNQKYYFLNKIINTNYK